MRHVGAAQRAPTKGKSTNALNAKASAFVFTSNRNPGAKNATGQVFVRTTENDGAAPRAINESDGIVCGMSK